MRGLLLVAGGALAACGPIRSTSILVDAAAEVAAAKTAGAQKHTPFELRSAEAYLKKAREEQGHADFEVSIALAQRARDCARAALSRIEGGSPPTDPTEEPMPDARCRAVRTRTSSVTIRRYKHPGLRAVPIAPATTPEPAPSNPAPRSPTPTVPASPAPPGPAPVNRSPPSDVSPVGSGPKG